MKLMHKIARFQLLFNQQLLQIESSSKDYSELTTTQFQCLDERLFRDQYNFTKMEVIMLRERLEINALITLENGSRCCGNLSLCILLDKLSYPIKKKRLESTYGLHRSIISRIMNHLPRAYKHPL